MTRDHRDLWNENCNSFQWLTITWNPQLRALSTNWALRNKRTNDIPLSIRLWSENSRFDLKCQYYVYVWFYICHLNSIPVFFSLFHLFFIFHCSIVLSFLIYSFKAIYLSVSFTSYLAIRRYSVCWKKLRGNSWNKLCHFKKNIDILNSVISHIVKINEYVFF